MNVATALTLRDVTVAYHDQVALSRVTLDVGAGEFVGVVGPNGAGKSTLLNAILGIVPLRGGIVLVGGRPPAQARAAIAYMPQRESVDWTFPVTVADVVLMGRQARIGWLRRASRADRAMVERTLAQVEMLGQRRTPIGHLSGGQQQRVFLARALAQEGDLLLLDEPLTGVDATTQEAILALLESLRQQGHTIVMTTHDLGVARAFCSRMLFLNRTLIAYGSPAETFTPDIIRRTYGGHVVRIGANLDESGAVADALLVLSDDAHHHGGEHTHAHTHDDNGDHH
jgi:ABC-type Mn2+/Zn2+ transport system ATPase subunit